MKYTLIRFSEETFLNIKKAPSITFSFRGTGSVVSFTYDLEEVKRMIREEKETDELLFFFKELVKNYPEEFI